MFASEPARPAFRATTMATASSIWPITLRNGGPLQNEIADAGTVIAADYTVWRRFRQHLRQWQRTRHCQCSGTDWHDVAARKAELRIWNSERSFYDLMQFVVPRL